MRFPLASAAVIVAIFAGCSSLQGSPSLPAQIASSATIGRDGPGPVLRSATANSRHEPHAGHHPRLISHEAATPVGLWFTNRGGNYLFGADETNKKLLATIDLAKEGCVWPDAVKVDHAQHAWVACEWNGRRVQAGVIEKYSNTGSHMTTYRLACPLPSSQCSNFSGYGYDSATDGRDLFAALWAYEYQPCGAGTTCSAVEGVGFEWWQVGKPSALPKLIALGQRCSPICDVGYVDVDGSGNLWFTYYGIESTSSTKGYGLAEVTNPTTNPSLTIIEPAGTYGYWGGVNVSGGGKVLNVVDQATRKILQYRVPLSAGGKPFNVLGPTPSNGYAGEPVSGGFAKNDTRMVLADALGWFDVGWKISANKWTTTASFDCVDDLDGSTYCTGAAYSPSDK